MLYVFAHFLSKFCLFMVRAARLIYPDDGTRMEGNQAIVMKELGISYHSESYHILRCMTTEQILVS